MNFYQQYMDAKRLKKFFDTIRTYKKILPCDDKEWWYSYPPGIPSMVLDKDDNPIKIHLTPVETRLLYDHFDVPCPTIVMKEFNSPETNTQENGTRPRGEHYYECPKCKKHFEHWKGENWDARIHILGCAGREAGANRMYKEYQRKY